MDGRRIRNNKVAFSNLSGIVWTRPKSSSGWEGGRQSKGGCIIVDKAIFDLDCATKLNTSGIEIQMKN